MASGEGGATNTNESKLTQALRRPSSYMAVTREEGAELSAKVDYLLLALEAPKGGAGLEDPAFVREEADAMTRLEAVATRCGMTNAYRGTLIQRVCSRLEDLYDDRKTDEPPAWPTPERVRELAGKWMRDADAVRGLPPTSPEDGLCRFFAYVSRCCQPPASPATKGQLTPADYDRCPHCLLSFSYSKPTPHGLCPWCGKGVVEPKVLSADADLAGATSTPAMARAVEEMAYHSAKADASAERRRLAEEWAATIAMSNIDYPYQRHDGSQTGWSTKFLRESIADALLAFPPAAQLSAKVGSVRADSAAAPVVAGDQRARAQKAADNLYAKWVSLQTGSDRPGLEDIFVDAVAAFGASEVAAERRRLRELIGAVPTSPHAAPAQHRGDSVYVWADGHACGVRDALATLSLKGAASDGE